MTLTQQGELRLRPGIIAVALQWLIRFGLPVVFPEAAPLAVGAGVLGALAVLVWWIFFSRVPKPERWGALLLIAAAVALTPRILHPSIVGGMMGMMFGIYVMPGLSLALVAWAALSRSLGVVTRRAALAAAILAACAFWGLLRTDGIMGGGGSQFAWRWKPDAEQKLLAAAPVPEPVVAPVVAPVTAPLSAPAKAVEPPEAKTEIAPKPTPTKPAAWPGFRGPHRDSAVTNLRIRTDWAASPPVELWRKPVGPGWSSFAVGDGVYTQEQRGDFEVVARYETRTGKPVWVHRDTARFWESNAGAGPRGTPTLQDGRVYTLGATGIVNALDANNGAVIWTRNAATDTGAKLPGWGFSGSPLVLDDLVIVAASGRLAAYDVATGTPRWLQKKGAGGYSSPQLVTLGGVAQVVFMNGDGVMGLAPADGHVLWTHPWPGSAMLQPGVTADGALFITTGDMSGGAGIRRLAVANGAGGWKAEEVWTSNGLKPYFNDFVIHKGHAFGFDGSILSCIDLQDGKRKWKGGRYGHGQMLLLADQDLLLVLSEEGELALVSAGSEQFTEVAKIPAIEGKTWNHPVVAGGTLFIRNGAEMAAFRLPVDPASH